MPAKKPIKIIGKVSSASVLKNTGKDWDEWIAILEKAGAGYWDHREIVSYLKKKHKLSPWWQQGVTLGYELHKGRRIEGMNLKGEFGTVASRTFPLPQKETWKLLTSPEGQAVWLKPLEPLKIEAKAPYECAGGIFGELRTFKAPLRLRMTWQETEWLKPSVLQVHVIPRPNGKSVVALDHTRLKDGRLRVHLREQWKTALTDLLELAKGRR